MLKWSRGNSNSTSLSIHKEENVMKALRPLFFIVAFTLMVGMACAAVSGGTQPTEEQPTEQDQPTEEEQPTSEDQGEADTPEAQSSAGDLFFTEEFDQDPGSDWEFFVLGSGA